MVLTGSGGGSYLLDVLAYFLGGLGGDWGFTWSGGLTSAGLAVFARYLGDGGLTLGTTSLVVDFDRFLAGSALVCVVS